MMKMSANAYWVLVRIIWKGPYAYREDTPRHLKLNCILKRDFIWSTMTYD